MNKDKFVIINLVKDLIISVDKNLINFPKREIELKREINNCSYELLLIVQEANITSNTNI